MSENKYIVIEGPVFKPDGWTEKEQDQLMDKIIAAIESFGDDIQAGLSFAAKTEDDIKEALGLEEDDDEEDGELLLETEVKLPKEIAGLEVSDEGS